MSSARPRVLLLGEPPLYQTEQWEEFQRNFDVVADTSRTRDEFVEALRANKFGDFAAILKPAVESGNTPSPWNTELVSLLPSSVRLFAAGGAGYDYADVPALKARGIQFTNSRGAGDTATSDLALFLILATFRLTSLAEWAARTGDPETFDRVHNEITKLGVNPRGKILGCVGLGAIQKEVARKAGKAGLGMKIKYYDVMRASAEVEERLGAEFVGDLLELAGQADCISLSVPYMKSTHHLVDASFLAAMRPGTRIVNTARGAVIDEKALISALQSGHLISAGLDVHYNEPKVAPELIAMRNVTLTAHIGGVARETYYEFERISMTNIDNLLRLNEALLTPV